MPHEPAIDGRLRPNHPLAAARQTPPPPRPLVAGGSTDAAITKTYRGANDKRRGYLFAAGGAMVLLAVAGTLTLVMGQAAQDPATPTEAQEPAESPNGEPAPKIRPEPSSTPAKPDTTQPAPESSPLSPEDPTGPGAPSAANQPSVSPPRKPQTKEPSALASNTSFPAKPPASTAPAVTTTSAPAPTKTSVFGASPRVVKP